MSAVCCHLLYILVPTPFNDVSTYYAAVQSTEERAKDTMILILKLSVSVCVAIGD